MAQDTYIDEMTIYNPSGKAIYDAPVTTSAIIKYALMGDYYIELPFSLLTPLDFPLGSYITYKGRKFEIMSEVYPDFDNKTGGYKYTLQFQAQQNHMKNFICFWLGGDNPEAVFHNTTDLASFGALIVANMNKALGGNNWQMGSVNVEHPETNKLVSFNGDTCWDALSSSGPLLRDNVRKGGILRSINAPAFPLVSEKFTDFDTFQALVNPCIRISKAFIIGYGLLNR